MVTRLRARVVLLRAIVAVAMASLPLAPNWAAQSGVRSINIADRFDSGALNAWQLPYAEDWAILSESAGHYLHMNHNREPGVPRRPLQYALLKNAQVGSFDLHVKVRREGGSMILVFNYVDTLHFYYTHLSVDPGRKQEVHNGIFLVNNAPRVRIAGVEAVPALPDKSWHAIRVLRDAKTGKIEVWRDVQKDPLFTVVDRTFGCGQVGLGSFDETGDFSDFDLNSDDANCKAGAGSK